MRKKLHKTSRGNYFGYYKGYYISIFKRPHGGYSCTIGKNGKYLFSEGYFSKSLPNLNKAIAWATDRVLNPVKTGTMYRQGLISLDTAKQLARAGIKQTSQYYWLYNDIGKFWDCVTQDHLNQYPDKTKLQFYSAFTQRTAKKHLLRLHPQYKHF